MGFPSGSDTKESTGNAGYLGWEDPLENGMLPTPAFLPGEFHRQRRLRGGYSPWGRKELDMTEQLTLSFFSLSVEIKSGAVILTLLFFSSHYLWTCPSQIFLILFLLSISAASDTVVHFLFLFLFIKKIFFHLFLLVGG